MFRSDCVLDLVVTGKVKTVIIKIFGNLIPSEGIFSHERDVVLPCLKIRKDNTWSWRRRIKT